MRKPLVLLAAAGVAALAAGASAGPSGGPRPPGVDRPLKVLMVGNSFSVCVTRQMPQVAADLGCCLDLCSLYIGGCPLSRHAANLSRTNGAYAVSWNYCGDVSAAAVPFAVGEKGRGDLRPMLAADRWDVVTIQQASHESWRPESYQPHADALVSAIRELAPQAEIAIQQTWSYSRADGRICDAATGGAGTWGFDQDGMYGRLTAAYARLAEKTGFRVIPTGLAVQIARACLGVVSADGDVVGSGKDTIHLNFRGEYLQGLVWAGALFGRDVTAVGYAPAGVDAGLAKLLRECAAEAVARGIR